MDTTAKNALSAPAGADSVPATSRGGQTQVAATSFLALFSIVGLALYGLPFFYDFMVRDFGWTRAEVTSGNFYSKLLIGPLFGFLAGWIVDRFGPRRMMMAGILMAGLALVGLSFTTTLALFYFFYLFNALGYVCGGPLPNQVLISRWFNEARGKAMGFAYLGIGVGGAVAPLLANWLTQQFGWTSALRTLGILIVVIALPLAFFVKESPGTATAAPSAATPVSIGGVLKSRYFYLLAIGSMCSIGAVGGTFQNLKLFMTGDLFRGMTVQDAQSTAAYVLSLVLISSLVGRILMGWLADRFQKKYVMLLIYLIVASSIPLLFLASNRPFLYLFAVLFGIGLGGDYMIIPLMAAELFGVKVLGRLMGVVLTADGVAEALAPVIVAKTRDNTGSYAIGFSILIALAFIGATAVGLLPKKEARVNS
ncbi:MAG TPA: MFS transporter [Pyrinomonadaceae bacterium]|nr:MFS transporter [Pyrinomonadaceae bacterium]